MARILVIDDEPRIRNAVRRSLESAGHEVVEAEDGKVALRMYAGNPTDVVISDIYMPHMDGIEFLIRLHEAFPEARVITMSGGGHLAKEKLLSASGTLGAVVTLEKPFGTADILAAVDEALGHDTPGGQEPKAHDATS